MIPTVACLVCTNRPEWEPWWRMQIGKQTIPKHELRVIVDDSSNTLPEKRTWLMGAALDSRAPFVAWFDDDDWADPARLEGAVEILEATGTFDAVGNVRSRFVSVESRLTIQYQAPEGIIFNGAVFRASTCPRTFAKGRLVSEDTEWLERWHRDGPNYIIASEPMHFWMCHRKNITNRVTERSFRSPLPPETITEEEWRLVPR